MYTESLLLQNWHTLPAGTPDSARRKPPGPCHGGSCQLSDWGSAWCVGFPGWSPKGKYKKKHVFFKKWLGAEVRSQKIPLSWTEVFRTFGRGKCHVFDGATSPMYVWIANRASFHKTSKIPKARRNMNINILREISKVLLRKCFFSPFSIKKNKFQKKGKEQISLVFLFPFPRSFFKIQKKENVCPSYLPGESIIVAAAKSPALNVLMVLFAFHGVVLSMIFVSGCHKALVL